MSHSQPAPRHFAIDDSLTDLFDIVGLKLVGIRK